MHISSRARIAGSIGMIGGIFWIISVIMQYSLGLFTSDGSPLEIAHTLLALSAFSLRTGSPALHPRQPFEPLDAAGGRIT